jgi:hypothetical protein
VQYVNRPDLNFRGFSGSVASGTVKVGDAVKVLPSGINTEIKSIVTADGELKEAFAPQAVTLTLKDEVDVSSGDMLVKLSDMPKVSRHFEAITVWMNETPLRSSGHYILRHCGRNVKARIEAVNYKIDVNTLEKQESNMLNLNEIGRIAVTTSKPLFYDPYVKNRTTGAFILIDPVSNATVGAGMISEGVGAEHLPDELNSTGYYEEHIDRREFSWDGGLVSHQDRIIKNRHSGKTVLITGRKGCGKHDFAKSLEKELFNLNMQSYYLGMSSIAKGLDADIGDSIFEWDEHIRRLGEVSRILTDAGLIVIAPLNNADEVDIKKLKRLNFPNEMIVIHLGDKEKSNIKADEYLEERPEISEAVKKVKVLLSAKNVIPDYCI